MVEMLESVVNSADVVKTGLRVPWEIPGKQQGQIVVDVGWLCDFPTKLLETGSGQGKP